MVVLNANCTVMKKHLLYAIFTFFAWGELYPGEILFKNGDAFLVEVTEEFPSHIKFVYKNSVYVVPRQDFVSYDPLVEGKDVSYRISKMVLKDGSSLQGVIVEEDDKVFTMKSELGFLSVSKNKIASGPSPPKGEPELPSKYRSSTNAKFRSKIGLSVMGMGSNRFDGAMIGLGFYYEPDGIVTPWNLKFGIRSEYAASQNVDLFSNFLYLRTYSTLFSYRTFFNIGLGVGYSSYNSPYRNSSGVNPAVFMEYGADLIEWESGFLRASLRNVTVIEREGAVFLPGVEFSVGTYL
jgi:hypothetical protein